MREAAQFLLPYLSRYRRGILLGFGALIIKDAVGAVLPLLIRAGIDDLTTGKPLLLLFYACAALVGLSAIKGLFQYWMRVILIGISRDVEYDLRNDLFRSLASLDTGFYGKFRTGDVMARATSDLNAVRMMLGPALMYTAETSLTFVLALGIMLSVDWRLTLWALSPAPLVSLVVFYFGQQIHHKYEEIQAKYSDISSRVQEHLSGVRVLRAYVQEAAEVAKFEELNRDYVDRNISLARLSALFMPLLTMLIGVTFLIVLFVGGRQVVAGEMSLGSFVMFNTFMGMLVWPMIAFGWVVSLVQRGTASLKRIREILDARPQIAPPDQPKALPPGPLAIELIDVSVVYGSNGNARKALDGVSLRVNPGETIAIVGRTGSGKSTLVHLLPRMLDPTSGQVLLGGADLRELDPEEIRKRIGFVPQETFLFSAKLSDNIAFGVEESDAARVENAAELAGLGPDLERFPNRLDTEVGERGLSLSGGQKQRTAIARAVMREPEILILDDSLSAVDTATEDRILHQMREFLPGRTAILISHRVSTVQDADRIYVLDQGRIVEEGNHEELIARGGYYADLYQKQLLEEELETL